MNVPSFDKCNLKKLYPVEEVVGHDLVGVELAFEPINFIKEGLLFEHPLFLLEG